MAKKHELLGKETEVTFKHWKASGKTYRNNTKSGFKGSKWEGHHVVPGTSMEQSLETFLEGKHEGYPKALATFTVWDLNKDYNMLGLPTATTYRKAYRRSRPISLNLNMPANLCNPMPITKQPTLPIHNPVDWGHTDFNDDVKERLDEIWGKLNAEFKKHEPIKAENMKDEIQGVSNNFRKKLQAKTGQKRQDWIDGKFSQFRMV